MLIEVLFISLTLMTMVLILKIPAYLSPPPSTSHDYFLPSSK